MVCVEVFISFLLVAGTSAAPGKSQYPFSIRALERQSFTDTLGESLPSGTEFTRVSLSTYHLALSIVNVVLSSADSLEDCYAEALRTGGDIYEYNSDTEKCNVASLQFPLCSSRTGGVDAYILPEFISDGTTDDGVTTETLTTGVLLRRVLSNPELDYGTFRVESPLILEYPEYHESESTTLRQVVFTETDLEKREIDADIFVDSWCQTDSACGVPFVYPRRRLQQNTVVLSDYCGKTINVGADQEWNLLSHRGFGCRTFPDIGYNRSDCRVNYRSSAPVRITGIYLNFVGNDECDGFHFTIGGFYNNDSRFNLTRVCQDPVRDIYVEYGRGRIDLVGTSANSRPKLGFILRVRQA